MNDRRALAAFLMAVVAWTHAMAVASTPSTAGLVLIPAGSFEMGDHHGFVDPKHGGDETPLHVVRIDAFHMARDVVTTAEYCAFLNGAAAHGELEVRQGGVYPVGSGDLLCETRTLSPYSRIGWDGKVFTVLEKRERHPMVCIRWAGAAAYCNWLSREAGLPTCYELSTGLCDFNRSGYRLPTEAEWEYAARGGQLHPYRNFPWGDDADPTRANWPESRNPFRSGPLPWTTPVGFFDGRLHVRSDFGWPGPQESFQAGDGTNGYGLHDMTGNVWQFVNDWYARDYYSYSPSNNPAGPAEGSIMPDGKPYRGMRGGNWYNGENGHGRVSNRNPSYFRGPQDPDHPYYHLGFRVVLPVEAEGRPVIRPTPVPRGAVRPAGPGGGPGRGRPPSPDGRREGGVRRETGGVSDAGDRPRRDSSLRPSEDPASLSRSNSSGGFVLRSTEVAEGGALPVEFTGDGASATLPLQWSGAPAGTRNYAITMHHEAPDQTKWYWILHHIPADALGIPKNVEGVGTLGINSLNGRTEYAPPRSKGPGPKTYVYTVYALSAPPDFKVPPGGVDSEALLAAMKDKVLARAELSVVYTRPGDGAARGPGDGPARGGLDDQSRRDRPGDAPRPHSRE